MMGLFFTRPMLMVLRYVYPAYECYKTVEVNAPEMEHLRFWCQYWTLVALLTALEGIADTFVFWLPMYSEAKLAFYVYLWYPKTQGTAYIYDKFFRPYIAKLEPEVDWYLLEFKTWARSVTVKFWQKAASYAQKRFYKTLFDSSPPPLLESISTPTSSTPPPPVLRCRIRQFPASPSPRAPAPNDSSLEPPTERRRKVQFSLKGQKLDSDPRPSSAFTSDQTKAGGQMGIPTEAYLGSGDANLAHDSSIQAVNDGPLPPQSFLENVAEFVIKTIFFHINLLFSFIKLPFRLLHLSFLIIYDPFGTLYWTTTAAKKRFLGVFNCLFNKVLSLVFGRVIGPVRKLVGKLTWGFFYLLYINFLLFWILVASFLEGHLIMRHVVEEPIQMIEELSFDYTKFSPEAFVLIPPYNGYLVSSDKPGVINYNVLRLVPPNEKLQATIALTLPESDYNRNVGVFQVRMELVSLDGTVTSTSSHPCLLRFKSPHVRLLETLHKFIFLLAGYSSESQVIKFRLRGLAEGTQPTVCIRVALERRAEHRPGAGIPEIYSASMKLESELPLLKRMIWIWKRILSVWISLFLFIMQLLLIVLVCCRPVMLPRTRLCSLQPLVVLYASWAGDPSKRR